MRRKFIGLSAVAAAAAENAVRASASVTCRIEDEESDNYEPDHFVIEKIAKTVHFGFCAGSPARSFHLESERDHAL